MISLFHQPRLRYTLLWFALLWAPWSFAAIQGEEGFTSTGQIVLRFAFQSSFQISRIDDIVLQVNNFDEPVRHRENLCIRGPQHSTYTLTADSETHHSFVLENGAGNRIPYQVFFFHSPGVSTADRLLPQERSKNYPITHSNRDCGGEDNSAVEILIEAEDLKKAGIGVYNGILILTVGSS